MKPNENVIIPQHHEETNEHEIRKLKIKKMMDEGLNPWQSHKPVSHANAQALETFKKDPATTQVFQLAGRVMTRRDHGKSFFCNIMDRSATIQLYIKKDVIGDHAFEQFKHYIDTGDIVWVEGTLFVTKMGETTLNVQKIELLSKCLHPLPEKFHGLADVEQRYRQRYLDLISNPESREKFKKRSQIVLAIRKFLTDRDFLEVETPMLHPIPGGAAARPFVTHHNAYNMDLYLRIAPELYLKRLVVGGFERVFEINRNFRNEGVSTRHNPEFTMLEFYMAHGDYQDGMALVEQLFAAVISTISDSPKLMFNDKEIDFTAPFKRMTVVESLIQVGGLTASELTQETIGATLKAHNVTVHQSAGLGFKLFALFEACVESKLIQPTFIVGYPLEISPLAKRDVNNPEYAARFELFINGMECANGFTELNDPFDQADRFKAQVAAREGGDSEAHHYDADYIKALEFGLAPAVGVGIGIDRVVMLMTNTHSIKDVILFPTLKITSSAPKDHNIVKEKTSLLSVDPNIFQRFPGTCLGVVVGFNLKNSADDNPEINALLRGQEETLKTLFKTQQPSEHPNIIAWREAYQKFGANPDKFRSSIENLTTRILGGHTVRHSSTLVDLYNFISLKYLVPAGGEDIDHLEGNVQLTFAQEHEVPVVAFGEKEAKKPEIGEVIYKDQGGTLCRRWNWRGTERSKLTSKTHNAFFIFEALPPVKKEVLVQATQELAKLIAQYCGGEIVTTIIDERNVQTKLIQDVTTSKE